MDDAELGAVVHARVRAAPAVRHDAPPRDATKPRKWLSRRGQSRAGRGRETRAGQARREASDERAMRRDDHVDCRERGFEGRAGAFDPRGQCLEERTWIDGFDLERRKHGYLGGAYSEAPTAVA